MRTTTEELLRSQQCRWLRGRPQRISGAGSQDAHARRTQEEGRYQRMDSQATSRSDGVGARGSFAHVHWVFGWPPFLQNVT